MICLLIPCRESSCLGSETCINLYYLRHPREYWGIVIPSSFYNQQVCRAWPEGKWPQLSWFLSLPESSDCDSSTNTPSCTHSSPAFLSLDGMNAKFNSTPREQNLHLPALHDEVMHCWRLGLPSELLVRNYRPASLGTPWEGLFSNNPVTWASAGNLPDQNNPCIWPKEKQTRPESHCDSREKDVQRRPPEVMAEKPHPQLQQQLSGCAEMPLLTRSLGHQGHHWAQGQGWTACFRLLWPGHRE